MKKLVCGLGNVYDKKWNIVYANNRKEALSKAIKHCGNMAQSGFNIAICDCADYYRVNFCAMPVTK